MQAEAEEDDEHAALNRIQVMALHTMPTLMMLMMLHPNYAEATCLQTVHATQGVLVHTYAACMHAAPRGLLAFVLAVTCRLWCVSDLCCLMKLHSRLQSHAPAMAAVCKLCCLNGSSQSQQ